MCDGPGDELPVGPGEKSDLGELCRDRVGQVAVGGVIVLAAEPAVVDPRDAGSPGIEPLPGGRELRRRAGSQRRAQFAGVTGDGRVRVQAGLLAACDVPDRDSKDPDGPLLTFTPAQWAAFTAAVRSGQFDLS